MDIINTTDTSDIDGFGNDLRRLSGSTDTNDQLIANPLVEAAQLYVISKVSDATSRSYPNRAKILIALAFIAAAYMLSGDAPSEVSSGTVKSETIGLLRTEYTTHTTGQSDSNSRAAFLLKSGVDIIDGLVGTQTDTGNVVFEVLA